MERRFRAEAEDHKHVRGQQGASKEIARLRLTSHPADGRITYELIAPTSASDGAGEAPSRWMPTGLMERVSKLLEGAAAPLSKNGIETAVVGKRDYVRQAVDCLVEEGYVEAVTGARGARLHRSVKPYREDPEPPDPTSPQPRP